MKKLPDVLTEKEIAALLKQPNKRAPTGLRNFCIMRIMLDAGLRASEVINLNVNDIDWESGWLKVRQGKGKKDRILWLNEDALGLLKGWRNQRLVIRDEGSEGNKGDKCNSDRLFVTLDGKTLSDRYLRAMVKRYASKAEISKNVHPHTLRHTFGTDLYKSTRNIRLVQKALGHADLSTTMIYTHIMDEELEDAMKSFRTRAN